jgi:hypothetical protein
MKVYAGGALKSFLDARARGAPALELEVLKLAASLSRDMVVDIDHARRMIVPMTSARRDSVIEQRDVDVLSFLPPISA